MALEQDTSETLIAHLPGPPVLIGTVRRQCCAWCGALLEEINLLNVHAIAGGESIAPPSFPTDVWGEFGDGSFCALGEEPPENACSARAVRPMLDALGLVDDVMEVTTVTDCEAVLGEALEYLSEVAEDDVLAARLCDRIRSALGGTA